MAPTPLTATGKLRLDITVDGLTHHTDMWCDVLDTGGGVYKIVNHDSTPTPIDPQDAADAVWTLGRVFYHTDVIDPAWTLFRVDGINLIPAASGSTSVGNGTNASTAAPAAELTFSFKTVTNRILKIVFMEPSYIPPGSFAVNGMLTGFQDFVDSMVDQVSGALELNDFVHNRGAQQPFRFVSWTATLNRKTRKARGFV